MNCFLKKYLSATCLCDIVETNDKNIPKTSGYESDFDVISSEVKYLQCPVSAIYKVFDK